MAPLSAQLTSMLPMTPMLATTNDTYTTARGNKLPDALPWMRSTGLSSADWAVITEYIDYLRPLKYTTERLEGRGKAGNFGTIYEIILVLSTYSACSKRL
jgi:hypothetical protein